ncbi:hypothetical protein GYMLUDRAFT_251023 [Collybiopsis luxurians FD-317 M1]|uniref:Major facilitator superfamily (MFS) profile domain-containing protein n=1 Tax=Collybiopsis luxurians FD-317 M1 TaxID=944289 RepID=A0A0D0BDN3_9AGAR|nr:hypothetical protein GYMLUDRAFT_251023 [Collybiopsis luxurians FD-317 M1]
MSPQVDEETPLLPPQQHETQRMPLPRLQFTLVLFLQFAEPLTSQVIYPFLPQLVRDIGITHGDETKVGHYSSLFFLTQAMTTLHWSRISDKVGRRPVILTGLFGLSVSMYCFGLSRTFWGLVLSRCLNGALNGNIGVIKRYFGYVDVMRTLRLIATFISILAEMTDTTNIAQAYAYMPVAWSSGSVLGPMIGGALARPADQFPNIFGHNEFLIKYPYFLPCVVPATFSAIAWLVTYLFLKETVKSPTLSFPRPFRWRKQTNAVKSSTADIATDSTANDVTTEIPDNNKPVPFRKLLNRRVLVAAGNYASLSLVDVMVRAIQLQLFNPCGAWWFRSSAGYDWKPALDIWIAEWYHPNLFLCQVA